MVTCLSLDRYTIASNLCSQLRQHKRGDCVRYKHILEWLNLLRIQRIKEVHVGRNRWVFITLLLCDFALKDVCHVVHPARIKKKKITSTIIPIAEYNGKDRLVVDWF